MRVMSFESIQKKLDKKNEELHEVRTLRKKLADKEKVICAEIENLQNQKVEAIFLQVKREIKNENLNVSTGSILPMLEALRNNQQPANGIVSVDEASTQANDLISDADEKTKLNSETNFNSIPKIAKNEEEINEHR